VRTGGPEEASPRNRPAGFHIRGKAQAAKGDDMIRVRRANDRGVTSIDWLQSRHSFSFGEYYDTKHMGFGALRVINEDIVAPGQGFATHGHHDMEIVTYVLSGALQHKDSLGTGTVIRPGEVQRMSAGTGIRHSEFNPSPVEPVHFLQIWILPEKRGLPPGYAQTAFDDAVLKDRLALVASRAGRDGSLTINRDVDLHAARVSPGTALSHRPAEGRDVWLQVAAGSVVLNGERLSQGDGAAAWDETELRIEAADDAEILLFDMAP
jgi:quercetin 2,3-dioxygenase